MHSAIDPAAAPTAELLTLPPNIAAPAAASSTGLPVMGVVLLVLVALDLAGAYCAMRFANDGQPQWWSAGAVLYVAMFAVYSASLRWGELSTVTLSWIVLSQVGVVVMDRVANGMVMPVGKLLAVAAMLSLMAYLVVAPSYRAYVPRHTKRSTAASITVDAGRTR